MGIKTVPHPPYSPDLAPCNFCLFPNLRGCHYDTTEEIKDAVTKVIDTLTQENFHGAFQKFFEWYNKCIAAGGGYFEGDWYFMCVLSIKVLIRKKSGNFLCAPCILPADFFFSISMHHTKRENKRKQKLFYFRNRFSLVCIHMGAF